MSLLASLVFVLAAFVVVAAVRSTVLQYRGAALRNVAALRDCSASRAFQVQTVTVVARQTADIRSIAARNAAPRRISRSATLRAAA